MVLEVIFMKYFEDLIKSDMSEEEVYEKIIEKRPIETVMKYTNDSEEPFAIFVGGIGEDDLVTVSNTLYTLKMRFDLQSIYLDFIKKVRDLCVSGEKSFEEAILSSVKQIPFQYFNSEDEEGLANNETSKIYVESFKGNYDKARDSYANDCSEVDEEKMEAVYNLSKFKGTKNLAKCVEINSIICNLLAFSGYEVVLAQGYYVDQFGEEFAHTFPFYKKKEGDYTLVDGAMKRITSDCLSGNTNFENGLNVTIPVVLKYLRSGKEVHSNLVYKVSPQRMIKNIKDTGKR